MNCAAAEVIAVLLHLDAGNIPKLAHPHLGAIACAAVSRAPDQVHALRLGELLVAVMDRETLCKNIEVHEDGHGHGFFGCDDRSHPAICGLALPDGTLGRRDVVYQALMAATELQANLDHYKGDETPALDAYNAGWTAVGNQLVKHQNPDLVTTGHDYAKDVLARAAHFFHENAATGVSQ